MSVSDLGLYKEPSKGTGVPCNFIKPPYLSSIDDPLWVDAQQQWQEIELQLERIKEPVCALILEPIIQGAGGMLCYSAHFLEQLAGWAKKNGIYLIADEIMTGLGRTGLWLAGQHAKINPDIICLSKGLTSGSIPFSCVMIDHSLFSLFYDDYHQGKSFLHSHTFSGHALGASAALATIKVMQQENIIPYAQELGATMLSCLRQVAQSCGKLTQVRGIGAVVAAELVNHEGVDRIGTKLYEHALKLGALIRPIGNTLYWLPPLNTDKKIIEQLAEITLNSINKTYGLSDG
jgi:adenosylmethionine-8-amino-7-oxononanoate aminotransferase